mmetsp:Transcript_10227/g.30772  ORF Transcript_10227/g.30772 Transcript_10227/m.30772 type:complete len:242 (+) Transcript_10227:161-886(+)
MPCLQPPQPWQPCMALPYSCSESVFTVDTRNVANKKPFPAQAWQVPEPLQVKQVFGILRCRSASSSSLRCRSRSWCSCRCLSRSRRSCSCLSSSSCLFRSSSSLALRRISTRMARLRSFSACLSRSCLSISSSSILLRSKSSFARCWRHLPLPPMRSILSKDAILLMPSGLFGSGILLRVRLKSRRLKEAAVTSAGELLVSNDFHRPPPPLPLEAPREEAGRAMAPRQTACGDARPHARGR